MGEATKGIGRREFLAGVGALAGALTWARVDRVQAADLAAGCATPPGFPTAYSLYKQRFENWSGEIVVDEIWTAAPRTPTEAVGLLRWATQEGYKLRPRGFMHAWAPLTVTPGLACDAPVLLVDTSAFSAMAMEPGTPAAVRVGSGATMEALLEFLHDHGHGLTSVPAIGQITVGGALAIGGHGAAVPAHGEHPAPGEAFGTLSNLVVSFTAVVWDEGSAAYVLRTFERAEPEASALLVHLGRAFLTEVVLRVGPARNLRCRSTFDTPAAALFAPPAAAGPDSFAGLLDQAGRVEAIWFAFTDKPWVKAWSVAPTQPALSRPTTKPYNYVFSDRIPEAGSQLLDQLISGPGPFTSFSDNVRALQGLIDRVLAGDGSATPEFGQGAYALSRAASLALLERDLWGPAFHTQLYIRATTLRFAELGVAVLTRRGNVQRVLSEVADRYLRMVSAYQARGLYPINGAVEIRASGLDHPSDVGVRGARSPLLSALRPRADHPDWDTAVWVNVLTFPGTSGSYAFYSELERWCHSAFVEPDAAVRVEWSKGWGYTPAGPWTDRTAITATLPDAFRGAATGPEDWDTARARLDRLDPHRVYTNAFLDQLLPPRT